MYVLRYVLILKLFFKAGKNVWTSDLEWCNFVGSPAEGDSLFNSRCLLFTALTLFGIKFV